MKLRASLVEQWIGTHLPVQETWVLSLVWEDPTCHGAADPMCHTQLLKPAPQSLCFATREAASVRSLCTATKNSPHSLQLGEAHMQQ